MKNSSCIFFLLLILLNFTDLLSQNHYFKGTLLINERDTLSGNIRNRFVFNSYKKIKFMGKNGFKQKFKAYQIYGYQLDNGAKYLSTASGIFGGNTIFMKVMEEGALTLLFYVKVRTNNYGTFRTTSTQTIYYLKKKGTRQRAKHVPLLGFRNFMLQYVFDDKEVKELIDNKIYRYSDLRETVRKYNENKIR